MKKTLINILKFVLPLGLGVFLIWYITKDLTPEQRESIEISFRTADYKWVALSLLLGFLSHFSRGYRWLILLEPLGHKPKLSNSFYAVMIGYLANLAFPRLGEVSRCGAIRNSDKIPFTAAFGTVVAERVIDLIMLMGFTLFLVLAQFDFLWDFIQTEFLSKAGQETADGDGGFPLYGIVGIALAALAILAFIFRSKLSALFLKMKDMLKHFAEGLLTIRKVKRKGAFLFHTVFIWGMYVLMSYVCFFALEETAGLSFMAILACFVFGSFGIVFTQGGIGAYHFIVASTLVLYGTSEETGYAFAWLLWSAQTLLVIALGFLSLILISVTNKNANQDESAPLAETAG